MDNPVDVFAEVKATMTEALSNLSQDGESAAIAICLGTAKRLAASEARVDLREFWAEKFYQAADELVSPKQSQNDQS